METYLTTRHGYIEQLTTFLYNFEDWVMADDDKRKKLINWLQRKSGYLLCAVDDKGFSTFEKLTDTNKQFCFTNTSIICPPFDNTQKISNIISDILKKRLSEEFKQFQNENAFIISEETIHPFKLLKVAEFNVEVFPSGKYLIHFMPVTKIISAESPITSDYLSALRFKFHGQKVSDIYCTLTYKNSRRRYKLDLLSSKVNEEIMPQIKDESILLATFDYHFLSKYDTNIFSEIADKTAKRLSEIVRVVHNIIPKINLPESFNLSPVEYFKADIVNLEQKKNLLVGCQYDENITIHSVRASNNGIYVEFTSDKISNEEKVSNYLDDTVLIKKIAGLKLPALVKGKVERKENWCKPYLRDIYVDGKINGVKVTKQSATHFNGVYKPANSWAVLPILYGLNDISLFEELIIVLNKGAYDFNILDPYIIQNDKIDSDAISKITRGKGKVFIAVLCKYEMPKELVNSIKKLKKRYQIYLGDTSDNQTNRPALSNYACKCIDKMDGIITLIADTELPESGYFIGIDLGHSTAREEKFSNLAAVIFNRHGLILGNAILKELPRNESLSFFNCKTLLAKLDEIIKKQKLQTPTHLVIHRDGKLHNSDINSITEAIKYVWGDIQIDIVEIIKSGFPVIVNKDAIGKAHNPVSGSSYQDLEHKYALLVTNTQADEQNNLIRPIVIKHRHGNTDFSTIVDQVFWLTRIYTNNLYNPTRLPATTLKANNIAGTSNKTHQATYLG